MSIQNAKRIGRFRPPAYSTHPPHAKTVYRGIESTTQTESLYYESGGRRFFIDSAEFQRWRKAR